MEGSGGRIRSLNLSVWLPRAALTFLRSLKRPQSLRGGATVPPGPPPPADGGAGHPVELSDEPDGCSKWPTSGLTEHSGEWAVCTITLSQNRASFS